MKILLTAEIDADSEAEAQKKLDEFRDYMAYIRPSVYDGISIFRARNREAAKATIEGGGHDHVPPLD